MSSTIAVLGTGAMGAGMARRLLGHGHTVHVWNRTPDRTAPLVEAGAVASASPRDAVATADAVLLCLADSAAVEQVLLGPDGVLHGPGALLVLDTSTTSVETAERIGAATAGTGHRFLEARVLGNPHHAGTGELRVLAGGPPEVLAEATGLLGTLAKDVVALGPWGAGARMKLALNMFLGVQLAALAEAADLGEASGLDRATVLQVLCSGGYAAPALAFRHRFLASGRYEPAAFRTDLMTKDLRLAAELGDGCGLALPLVDAAEHRFDGALHEGHGALDAAIVAGRVPAAVPA